MRTRPAFILAGFVLFAVSAWADPPPREMPLGTDTLVIPAATPLRYRSFDRDNVLARFDGRITLSGTYHFGFDETLQDWDVYLTLDPRSRGLLPYWKLRQGNGTLQIDNEGDFVRAVIPAEQIARLKAAKTGSITGKVAIVADGYEAQVVCDAPDYSVHFVSLVTANVAMLDKAPAELGC